MKSCAYPKQRRLILNHPKPNSKHAYFQGSSSWKRAKGTDNIKRERDRGWMSLPLGQFELPVDMDLSWKKGKKKWKEKKNEKKKSKLQKNTFVWY